MSGKERSGQNPQLNHRKIVDPIAPKEVWVARLIQLADESPEEVDAVVTELGVTYYQQGLHNELFDLLKALPLELSRFESVLHWSLIIHLCRGGVESIRQNVHRYLTTNEAPELRSLYAGTLTDPVKCLEEAHRALNALKTPLTLYQYGRSLLPGKSLEILHEAVTLAENLGDSHAVCRNGSFYARRLLHVGRFSDAIYWATWTRHKMLEENITGTNHYVLLANTLAYAQLLTGQIDAADKTLRQVEPYFSKASLPVQQLLLSTQADVALIKEDMGKAEDIIIQLHRTAVRHTKGETAKYLVRILLERRAFAKALKTASEAVALTLPESEVYSSHASLALAMAQVSVGIAEGKTLLQELLKSEVLAAHRRVQAAFHLAKTFLDLGDERSARNVLLQPSLKAGLKELSREGAYLLIGPRGVSNRLFELCSSPSELLKLYGFGNASMTYAGTPLDLTPRLTDILFLLALHPRGLTADSLLLLVAEDSGSRRSIVSSVSQLRKLVPITPEPYRLDCLVDVDVTSFQNSVAAGDLAGALRIYKGALLPYSSAPGIHQARAELEELLKQAALASKRSDLVMAAANHLSDDLELWEYLLNLIPSENAQASIVKARVASLRKSWGLA